MFPPAGLMLISKAVAFCFRGGRVGGEGGRLAVSLVNCSVEACGVSGGRGGEGEGGGGIPGEEEKRGRH